MSNSMSYYFNNCLISETRVLHLKKNDIKSTLDGMISFPGGSCSRGNPKGAAVMQGSHGKMRKDGSNCLRTALQASLLVHQGHVAMAIGI